MTVYREKALDTKVSQKCQTWRRQLLPYGMHLSMYNSLHILGNPHDNQLRNATTTRYGRSRSPTQQEKREK